MIDKDFVAAIADLVSEPRTMLLASGEEVVLTPKGAGTFSVQNAKDFTPKLFTPPTLQLTTLQGLVDYLRENRDEWPLDKLFAHVVSPTAVNVYQAVDGPRKERVQVAEVRAIEGPLPRVLLGEYVSHEDAIVGLQWATSGNEGNRADVLKMLGNIVSGASRTATDDGITQEVNTKVGISMKATAAVPNPVLLAPFRTFREVAQPLSPYIVRVQGGNESAVPRVALFLADGHGWQLVAIERVAHWLRMNLSIAVPVIA